MSRYSHVSTSTLRAVVCVLSAPGLLWVFEAQVAEMQKELLARELPSIADESGGFLVAAPAGVQ